MMMGFLTADTLDVDWSILRLNSPQHSHDFADVFGEYTQHVPLIFIEYNLS